VLIGRRVMTYLPVLPHRPSQRLLFGGYTILDSLLAILAFNVVSFVAHSYLLVTTWPHPVTRAIASFALGLFSARVIIGTPPQPRREGRPDKPCGYVDNNNKHVADPYDKFHTQTIQSNGFNPNSFPQKVPNQVDIVIIGASALGVSTAAILRNKYGLDAKSLAVLEKNSMSGGNWRERYKRVTLHDVADLTSLPFTRIPHDFPVWIDHRDYADYQDKYVQDMDLPSVLYPNCEVLNGEEIDQGKRWKIAYRQNGGEVSEITCRVVITCPGDCNIPFIPKFEGIETFPGKVIHSSDYSAATEFEGKKVLVVGFGKSGSEIALDLWEHNCEVAILSRGIVAQVPRPAAKFLQYAGIRYPWLRYFFPTDFLISNVLLMIWTWLRWGDLSKGKIRQEPFGPKFYPIRTWWKGNFAVPAIDVGTVDLILNKKIGIIDSGIQKIEKSTVHLLNGETFDCDAIILATGFRMHKLPGINTVDGGGAIFKVTPGKSLAIYFHGNLFWGVRCVYLGVSHLARGLGLQAINWDIAREYWIILSLVSFIMWNCILWNIAGIWTFVPWLRLGFLMGLLLMNAFTIVSEDIHWMYP
jgi:indole-3-pyruvate monooxygenase